MPIKSYLAHPHSGKKDSLIKALCGLPNCEVIPAENENLLIVVAEADNQEHEDKLKQTIKNHEILKLLAMVSAIAKISRRLKLKIKPSRKLRWWSLWQHKLI